MREDAFQDSVVQLAQLHGWRVAHFRPAQTAQGWRTPVSADGLGFPDLVMVRAPEFVVAELKGERGRVGVDQEAWLAELRVVAAAFAAGGQIVTPKGPPAFDVYVWRPSDWPAIEERLKRRRRLVGGGVRG